MTPGAWTDRDGRPRPAPEPPADGAFYQPVGDFQGAAYERNAFALGTDQEVAFLSAALHLAPGNRVVDVGCGTGRHTRALAARGLEVLGVDLSHGLLAVAETALPGRWVQGDARRLPLPDGCADAVICLCQGGFGSPPDADEGAGDETVLGELARLLRPGGRLALTAFSAWFAARYLDPEAAVDAARSLVHHDAEVRGADDERRRFDLWTTCYTAPHLAMLVECVDLELETLSGVQPGQYGRNRPRITDPELLLIAKRGTGSTTGV